MNKDDEQRAMNAGRRNSHRPRHSLLHFLLWASFSSLRIPDCASTSTTNDNDEGRNHSLAHHHYLFHEIDFLAKQSMIMGDVHARNDLGTRLRFLEKSILIELEYMIILDKMISNPDEILSAYSANNAAKTHQKNTSNEAKNHQKKTPTTLGERIADAISSASWPSMASPPQSKFSDSSFKLDHEYDYDWSSRNGYLDMYNNLDCWYHARDQNKPIYTPEMWDLLWEAFRKSTLFPFPSDECPKEPFYAAYTKDDKGRGAFATRKITNGSLVHAGYPNTVFFLDKKSWFRFVSLLPKMFACGKYKRVPILYTDFNIDGHFFRLISPLFLDCKRCYGVCVDTGFDRQWEHCALSKFG